MDLVNLIKELGFPVFIAVWMLTKSSRETKELTNAVIKMNESIIQLKDVIVKCGK